MSDDFMLSLCLCTEEKCKMSNCITSWAEGDGWISENFRSVEYASAAALIAETIFSAATTSEDSFLRFLFSGSDFVTALRLPKLRYATLQSIYLHST